LKKNTNLSKSTIIRSLQCQKSLYLYKYYYQLRDSISQEQQAVFNRGHSIGTLAQNLFPNGKNVTPKSPRFYQQSVAATQYLIQQNYPVIYEAAFWQDGIIVFLDILVHTNGKWYAYEVKSSKKISETYIKDAAIQYYVIKASGLAIADFSIIYLNENYDYALANAEEWDIHELFNEQSVLQEILDLQPYIQETVQNAKATLESDEIPIIEMGDHCDFPYTCDFKGFCKKT
jgi:hypothetical protein